MSNNAKFTTEVYAEVARKSKSPSAELARCKEVLSVFSSIMNSLNFKKYVAFIDTEIEVLREKLERAKDPVEIYRLQGELRGYARIHDVERYYKYYLGRVDSLSRGIKNKNENGEK